jgi:hypothetical protein
LPLDPQFCTSPDDDVERGRLGDLILKAGVGGVEVFLPQYRFDAHASREFAVQLLNHQSGAPPLCADVGGGGDEQTDHSLGHAASSTGCGRYSFDRGSREAI